MFFIIQHTIFSKIPNKYLGSKLILDNFSIRSVGIFVHILGELLLLCIVIKQMCQKRLAKCINNKQ